MSDNTKKCGEVTLATFENKDAANTLRQILLSKHKGCQLWVYVFNNLIDNVPTFDVAVANSFGNKLSDLLIENLKCTTDAFLDVLTAPTTVVVDETTL